MKRTALADLHKLPQVAWGTLALSGGLLAVWLIGVVGGTLGRLPAPLGAALATVGAYAAFTVMHDASHQAVGRARWLNSLLGHMSASLLLARFVAFQNVHRRHHRYTGDPARDPDRYSGEGPTWQRPLRWATADLHYYFEYDPQEGVARRDHIEAWLSGAVLAAALAGLLISGHGKDLLLFWVLPARLALFFLTYSFDYVPHQRPHGLAASEDRYRATFVVPGRLANLLLLGQNYHLLHHLYPAVPFYRYPALWRVMAQELRARGAQTVSLFARPRPHPAPPPGRR